MPSHPSLPLFDAPIGRSSRVDASAVLPKEAGGQVFFDLDSLPTDVGKAIWRAVDLPDGLGKTLSSGHPSLDAELPGKGWPCGSLTELMQAQPNLFEFRLLAPSMASVVNDGGQIFLVGPPLLPNAPGLHKYGIRQSKLIWIDAKAPSERLWAVEQIVKSNPQCVVAAWLPQARPEQIRRLQVCAARCDGPVFLFRPLHAQHEPSAAPLRLVLRLGDRASVDLEIIKRRGGQLGEHIALKHLPVGLDRVLLHRVRRTVRANALDKMEQPDVVVRPATSAAISR